MIPVDNIAQFIQEKRWPELHTLIQAHGLEIQEGKLVHPNPQTLRGQVEFYDKRQLVKKISLNSAYGSLLNPHCRFHDNRLGQSTTLSGRVITRHMNAQINQAFTGEYDHQGKTIIYADTDSCYFSAWPVISDSVTRGDMSWDRDACVKIYDALAEQVNQSFPEFCTRAFHLPASRGSIIRSGRELVASRGVFITKKRYAVQIYDLEGQRLDQNGRPGKLKAMGLDLKRSDTPRYMQDFLRDILGMLLTGESQEAIFEKIREFRREFQNRPAWEKGTPKRVNKLTHYQELTRRGGKVNMPGHVRASLNWNTLRDLHGDHQSQKILDGTKVVVCKLRDNVLGFTSVAFPVDELRLPEWFCNLPFDTTHMEETIVDSKLDNLLGVLGWDLRSATSTQRDVLNTLFTFN